MTCEVYEARKVKRTVKDHICEYCGGGIPKGSPAVYEHGIFEHEAFYRYCCEDCYPFIGDFWDYADGESYDLISHFHEFVYIFDIPHPMLTVEVTCPKCGTVRVMRDDWEGEGWAECPKCLDLLEV